MHVGFDYGELRYFTSQDVKGMPATGVLLAWDEEGGLVDKARVADRAESVTTYKDGRMPVPRPVGVLVGKH
eukprot:5952658-Pleurochrysis_carterae.AAC.1